MTGSKHIRRLVIRLDDALYEGRCRLVEAVDCLRGRTAESQHVDLEPMTPSEAVAEFESYLADLNAGLRYILDGPPRPDLRLITHNDGGA